MRALAQFIMQGRWQACLVGFLPIPIISPAAAVLVLLRGGVNAAMPVFLAASGLAILLVILVDGSSGSSQGVFTDHHAVGLLAFLVLGQVGSLIISAWLLRSTRSWNLALVGIAIGAGLTALSIFWFQYPALEGMSAHFAEVLGQVTEQQANSGELYVPSEEKLLGELAISTGFSSICILLLARWWQAMLYNPGGFRQEILNLRLHPAISALCFVGALISFAVSAEPEAWIFLCLLPVYIAAAGLAHWIANAKRVGSEWLVVFYLLFLFTPLKGLFILMAIADSFLNLRGRIAPRSQDNSD